MNTGTSQIFLPAKFHSFALSGLFFIHKNKRVQFFMKHRVHVYAYCKPRLCINIHHYVPLRIVLQQAAGM